MVEHLFKAEIHCVRSKRAKPSQSGAKRRVSVIVYLAAAFGVTITALSGVLVYTSNSAFVRERERAVDKARSAANLVAIGFGREYDEMSGSIEVVLGSPELTGLDPAVCLAFMDKYLEWPEGYLSIVMPDGSVVCSSDPRAMNRGKLFARASWMKDVLAGKTILFTEPARDVVTGNLGVATIAPFRSPDGRKAIMYAASGMRSFYTLTQPELQLGTEILIIDRNRTMVLDRSVPREKNPETYAGKSVTGTALANPITKAGVIIPGVDGVEGVYAEKAVKGLGWHILSGIKTSVAFAEARQQRARSVGLGLATIFMVLILGYALHSRLAKPMRSLTRAIEAAASDPDATAPEQGPAEVAKVAATFNVMNDTRRRSEARFRALVLHASDMIAVVDEDGAVSYCSPAIARLAGIEEDSVVRTPFASIVAPKDQARVNAAVVTARRKPGLSDPIEFQVRHRDGTVRQVEALLNNLAQDPAVGGLVATVRDITERKSFEEHLAHQALHDPLTDLPNRALALDRLAHALARSSRTGGTTGVLFMDLDRFKLINDSHGHAVGDRVLVLLADRLLGAVRPSDTVARFGGDEFVAVCDNLTDESDALDVAGRMAAVLKKPFSVDGQELFLTGSVGIALSGRGETAEELLRNADAAMYRAKERGRAGHAVFDEAMRTTAMGRLQIEAALHHAIEANTFIVQFQPKFSLADGHVTGAEALVRMVDEERGIIPPAEFIAVAEDTGLIVPIGEIVLREAALVARGWRDRTGFGVPVAVNLSPRQLAQPNLPDVVERILRETELDPELLILEITENLLMQDSELAATTLQRLRRLGVRISIDDFGTGHSSLGYLQTFPIDELKIDRSFVDALEKDERSPTIIGSIVGLAHAIGLTVVAEGVEKASQLAELRRLGCDIAQGYYFSHPRSAEAVEEMLGARSAWGAAPRP